MTHLILCCSMFRHYCWSCRQLSLWLLYKIGLINGIRVCPNFNFPLIPRTTIIISVHGKSIIASIINSSHSTWCILVYQISDRFVVLITLSNLDTIDEMIFHFPLNIATTRVTVIYGKFSFSMDILNTFPI